MIIKCINCDKKFEVNSSLIPNEGRTIQCGSCHHVWFYTPETSIESNTQSLKLNNNNKTDLDKKESKFEIIDSQNHNEILIPNENIDNKASPKKNLENKKVFFNLSKFLSYILVFLISFIALIIILDTFKSPISKFFPDLELFLYNLFESIKDVYLFLENLLI